MINNFKKIIITGGAGFIGGALIRNLLKKSDSEIFNIDKLGYASNLKGIEGIKGSRNHYKFLKINLNDKNSIEDLISEIKPDLIIHLAAESHVDRSISSPSYFIESNILGTFNLLEATRKYLDKSEKLKKDIFRFHHVSTDEVFGTLNKNEFFDESSQYSPRSPYSASKASSDHLVRSWHHTYGIPIVITNCSNNYGPYQFPEKLIPLTILKALNNENIPIYGDGSNERDWLFVDDHIDAIKKCVMHAEIGETYCIGGNSTKTNLEVVKAICFLLNKIKPSDRSYEDLITFVEDRPGHDERYAIDNTKICEKLNWKPNYSFEDGLEITVKWYLNNLEWCKSIMKKSGYTGKRLGIK